MEDAVSIQTRAMTDAQCMEGEVQRIMDNDQEEGQRAVQNTGEIARDPAMNPIVEIHKNDDLIIEEFVQQQGGISLDWYIPHFANTQVKTLIKNRVRCATQRGRNIVHLPATQRILPHINLRARSNLHIPQATRGHRHSMPTGRIPLLERKL